MGAAPGGVQKAAYRVWMAVGVLALLFGGTYVLGRPLAVIVPPLLLATVIVYVLAPIVNGLAERGVPRVVATFIAYLAALAVLAAVVALLVPLLVEQARGFAASAPQLFGEFITSVNGWLGRIGLQLPVGEQINVEALSESVDGMLTGTSGLGTMIAILGGLSGLATGFLQVALVFVLGPVIAFYALADLPRLRLWVRGRIPPAYRDEARELGRKLHEVVGGYVRGQLLVALFVGVGASLGLAIVGLPFWLLVGVIAGVTNLIPLLGPFIAGLLGVSIALVSEGIGLALLVLLVLTVVQQIDNHVVSPLVMGRNVRVHPLVVLLALVVAGTLYGIFGLLIAVPAVAAANVLAGHFWQTRVPWADAVEPAIRADALTGTRAVAQDGVAGPANTEDGVPGAPAVAEDAASRPDRRRAGAAERQPATVPPKR